MVCRLKGWLGPEVEYWGKKVRWLWFKCPSPNLAPHNESIPVSMTGSFEARPGKPVWHGVEKNGILEVSPSIDASASPCKFHDFYEFELVSEAEACVPEPGRQ